MPWRFKEELIFIFVSATLYTLALCVMPARQFAVSFARSGTFALQHIRHSNQSNAKEPASPTRDSRTKSELNLKQVRGQLCHGRQNSSRLTTQVFLKRRKTEFTFYLHSFTSDLPGWTQRIVVLLGFDL